MDIELSINGSDLPGDIRDFLREAYLRVGQFVRNNPIRVSGFAPSGFATVYRSLRAIEEAKLAPGNSFCEWGSGFGVDWDILGSIEPKSDLVTSKLEHRDDACPVQDALFNSKFDRISVAIGMVNVALLVAWLLPYAAPVVAMSFVVTYLASFAAGGARWLRKADAS